MRLIDADALVKKICFRCKEGDGEGMCAEFCRFIAALDNTPTIDAATVVRCKDCKNRGTPYSCPMRKLVMPFQGAGSYEDCTEDDGYCHMGAKMDGGKRQ